MAFIAFMREMTSVREWREQLGLTQLQAAALLGWSHSHFCKYDRGEYNPPLKMQRAMHSVQIEREQQAA